METRSRKSRSLTPFSAEEFSQGFLEKERLVENTNIVHVTRQTNYKIKEFKSVDEVTSTKSTSDYSSGEENEVSSTRIISQNDKNQLIEDARVAANGSSKISALDLYKKSGRYWEVYPKTDYTYSPHSRDRVEIAPGVIAMPNMSRKNIHSISDVSSSFTEVEHKQTNTESFSSRNAANYVSRQLFNNNNYSKSNTKSVTIWTKTKMRFISTFTKILTIVTSIFSVTFRTHTYLFTKLHKLASNVMLMDTWLLWKKNPGSKFKRLAALCLVPLMILGACWIFSNPFTTNQNQIITKLEEIAKPEGIAKPEAIATDKLTDNILTHHQKQIDDLKLEISNLKTIISPKIPPIIHRVNRCCQTPTIPIINLINDPEFLKTQSGLTDYLKTVFTAKQEMESNLKDAILNLDAKYSNLIQDNSIKIMNEITKKIKLEPVDYSDIPDDRIKKIVKSILSIYDADKTGLVDYAMESMGAEVLSTRCTENYHYGKAVVSVLGIPLWYPVNSPRTLITPGINPGQCWAFQNFPGFVMIKLSKRIKVEAFSIEHISRLSVPNGEIDSAPKDFEIYGLEDENDKTPVLLGVYQFDYDGEPLQYFDVDKEEQVFEIVELRIISNHGNPSYTCLYRFRVHGKSV